MTYAAFRFAALGGTLCATLAMGSHALAAGIPAGTLIENTASASYNTGGPTQVIDSNTVSFQVAELLDVAVASQDASALPITSTTVLTFSVTNTGNGPEPFVLTANPAVSGNDFDVTIDGLAIDSNGNGVYDAGTDVLLANGGTSASLNPDESITVFVLVTAPGGTTDGQTSQVRLLAEADTGTGTPGDVFTGAGEGGVDAVVGSTGADDDDVGSLISSVATVSLVKSVVITDPFGGTQPVPGAIATFTLSATVVGTGSINDLLITDAIPTSTTYAPGTLTLDTNALTDAADTDAGEASASGVAVNLGTVAAGTTHSVTFQVEID
ncbi:MAG: hypothetical protein KJZ64_11740 [Sphingomonadaceae bacterium]|nr:hypothetical protein [Sphingomonadaceae bacterium]